MNGLVYSGRCSIGCNLGHWLAAREMESESVGNGERNTLWLFNLSVNASISGGAAGGMHLQDPRTGWFGRWVMQYHKVGG